MGCAVLVAHVAAAVPVDYCAADGTARQTNATVVTASASAVTWSAGWYAVTNDVTLAKGVTCSGAVNLILVDDARLTVTGEEDKDAVAVLEKDAVLTIYGQQKGTGALEATGGYFGAGIGVYPAGTGKSCHLDIGGKVDDPSILVPVIDPFGPGSGGADPALTINGGMVRATGGDYGAGIGGRYAATNTSIVVNGGRVTATGGRGGAGIGGGSRGKGKDVSINGGRVTATGSWGGAGIGGGAGGDAGDIIIRGGYVKATGGETGSGIGAGGADMSSGVLSAGTCGNIRMDPAESLLLGDGEGALSEVPHSNSEVGNLVSGYRYCEITSPYILVPASATVEITLKIPNAWFAAFPGFEALYGTDYEAAARNPTGKNSTDGTPLVVWQDYIAGTDPTDTNDVFRVFIDMEDGEPSISWEPNLNTGAVRRIYKVSGRTDLKTGTWGIPFQHHRFFKVTVAMPTGAVGEVSDISGNGVLGSVQLWENGPYWAMCNVGATKPEEYGYYFWWGDTIGYKRTAADDGWVSVKDGSSFLFTGCDCPTYDKDSAQLQSLGYIDAIGNLVTEYDAATAHLGAPWRMPTDAEMDALISNCTTTWMMTNGVYGRLVTGKGAYSSKSIFLPAAGSGIDSYIGSAGSYGDYWSSTPNSDYPRGACGLNFKSGYFNRSSNTRYLGQSVRPVRGFAQ